jgi:DNA-3-methyladenine glycosylase II
MIEIEISLPRGYKSHHAVNFHSRDAEGVGEQVHERGFRKGVMLHGVATVIDISFAGSTALCKVDYPARAVTRKNEAAWREAVDDAIRNMLGLRIDPAGFAKAVKDDPLLAPLAVRHKGLRIIQSATVFEALTWAIIGQQINLTFAITLRRTLILQAGTRHKSGIWCYPEPKDVLKLDIDELLSRQFSRAKAETIMRVADLAVRGELPLERSRDAAEVSERLLAVKGVGPWTVNYALLRGYGYPDCSMHGDVAVREAIHRLTEADSRPSIADTEQWLAAYAPHRTMLAAHLWASLSDRQNESN